MKTKTQKSKMWLLMFVGMPLINFAQEAQVNEPSCFSNTLFNTLLAIIVILVIVIVGMANAVKNVSQSEYFQDKIKKAKAGNSGSAKIGAVALFMFSALMANAQEAPVAVEANDWLIGGLDMFTFYFMLGIILLELFFIFGLYYALKGMLVAAEAEKSAEAALKKVKPVEKTIFDKLNAAVEVEREQEIMLDHDYDGIKELDNDLPPWWKYGFYLTIVVAVFYLIHYHISGTGDLQEAEYNMEVAKAKAEVEAYMKTAASNVDETNVKMLDAASDIESGKQVYQANCAACHGKLGEGGVGPNFADEYWMHGGSIQDIFITIKYGYPDKGMKAWSEDLSPMQIAQVSSFIRTLKGTNPPNGKAPQGDLYKEDGTPAAGDSTTVVTDSLTVVVLVDSLAKASAVVKK